MSKGGLQNNFLPPNKHQSDEFEKLFTLWVALNVHKKKEKKKPFVGTVYTFIHHIHNFPVRIQPASLLYVVVDD